MRKQVLKLAALVTFVGVGTLFATDFKTPLVIGRGPIGYTFKKTHKKKYNLDLWSAGYFKEFSKAYIKHGTKTSPLTELMFGKSEFTLSEAFENSTECDPYMYLFQNTNPFLGITQIAPRVSYTEKGVTLGGKLEYPVWKNKGRVGLRVSVPIKQVRMERDDYAEEALMEYGDLVIDGDAVNITDSDGTRSTFFPIKRFNMALVNNLLTLDGHGQVGKILKLDTGAGADHYSGVNARQYNLAHDAVQAYTGPGGANPIPYVILVENTGSRPPFGYPTGVTTNAGNVFSIDTDLVDCGRATANTLALNPDNLPTPGDEHGYVFARDYNYTQMTNAQLKQLWLSPIFGGTSHNNLSRGEEGVIDAQLRFYKGNIYEWLQNSGNIMFQTHEYAGIGDIPVELYYEHTFNDKWVGEISGGLVIPTGGGKKYSYNPYRVRLGNGGHVELKLGAMAAWKAVNWLGLKLDASYNFVLSSVEQRAASYKGATVKNLLNREDANVDWGYFVGHFDFNFYHPKTSSLSSTIGYEFLFKTEDKINFKNKTSLTHPLGKAWGNGAHLLKVDETQVGLGVEDADWAPCWIDSPMTLDNSVARKNTEEFAHKVRFESNYAPMKYLDLFVGGAYVFAGKNAPKEAEGYAGFNVKF
jgi:hypothetical protein